MGPLAPEKKRRHRQSRSNDLLDQRISFARHARRWVFPLIVILVTLAAVAFILARRNRELRPQIILPEQQP